MGLTILKTIAPLDRIQLTDKALMREIGLLARERIIARTTAGKDQDDHAFAPYSPGYRKAKLKAVGKASPVNLQLSGGMLNALQIVEVTDTSVTLAFV